MKKANYKILPLCLVMVLCAACGNKANPMALPETADITSVEIVTGNTDTVQTDAAWVDAFITKAKEAIPTRKESLQDIPDVSTYTRVDLIHSGEITSLFIYTKSDQWYIEQPYLGIYKTDDSILEFLHQ